MRSDFISSTAGYQARAVTSAASGVRRAAAPQPAMSDADREAARAHIEDAMRDANRALAQKGAQLTFELDDQTKRVVVRLVDATTREVLRQIPTKEALAIARALSSDDGAAGLIRALA